MNYKGTARFAAVAAVLAVAISAQAFTIDVSSVGKWAIVGANLNTSETVIFQSTSVVAPVFVTNDTSVVNAAPPTPGVGLLDDGAGNSITYSITFDSASGNFNGVSASGTWNYVAGTGFYAGLVGGGTITENYDGSSGLSLGTVVGDLRAVPEPASMAAMGLGIVGLIARRRRK